VSLRVANSLTLRITLLFATASTIVLLALGFLIRDSIEKHFEELDTAAISSNLQLAEQTLAGIQSNSELLSLANMVVAASTGDNKLAVVVFDRDGKSYFSLGGRDFPTYLLGTDARNGPERSAIWEENGKSFRGMTKMVPTAMQEAPTAVAAAAIDISHHQHFMAMFQVTLWWFVAIAALLMGFLGWVAARHGLAPLRRIQQDASAVSATNLGQRLSVEQLPAELADLGDTINSMLARLEVSFERLSDFSADIAHELRTPISNMMTQTQVALSKPRTADEYHEILASNAEELERMARMISDMLFLAKADHGLISPHSEQVSLSSEFGDLFGFYEALADEKSVKLKLSGDASMSGDKLMLRRAFSNLLSNAIRHTASGEEVSVSIKNPGNGETDIEISNPGEIPSEHLSRLFDRFYRVDPSRHEASDGAGLGLAITQSIVQMHGGAISVQSSGNMTRFVIRFPNKPVRSV
jgi:two-component system heavy metal sensor histidine kinase CusS